MTDESHERPRSRSSNESDASDDPRVLEVVEDYLREIEKGRRPDRAPFLNRYPELAREIDFCLDGLEMIHTGLGEPFSDVKLAASLGERSAGRGPVPNPLGDFQIVRELARGGMGIVYEAVQLSLGRRVALKVLPFAATIDERRLQRFKIEAQAAALLHHSHIVPIYAVGCERGVHFYAMQLIEGQSLAATIAQLREKEGRAAPTLRDESQAERPPGMQSTVDVPGSNLSPRESLSVQPQAERSTVDISAALTSGGALTSDAYIRRACRLIVQAAQALEHAHQSGVVHRDIKPANLLVDGLGNLWVTDFGLAQLQTDHGLTRSGDLVGTFRYISPEQTSGQKTVLDHRTDIYSLGATFYELLALEPVFPGETHQELLYQILHTEPRPLRDFNRGMPRELETIIFKTLSKNPVERYRTAAEMAADVQRYLDNQPILARRPSLVDRARKWSRRHPAVVIAAVALLFVVAAGSLVSNQLISQEQARTSDALAREKLRAEEVEQQFKQARQAVDTLFQISEEELTGKPMEAARKRVLEVVLAYYQDFVGRREGDPVLQAELARVQDKVKTILHELNVMHREQQLRLLASDEVQDDLGLDDDQAHQLAAMLDRWQDERRESFSADRESSEVERRSSLVATAEGHERELARLLSASQFKRFRQIGLQSLGIFAFKESDVIQSLQLTSEQLTRIRSLEHDFFAHRMEPGKPGGKPPHQRGREAADHQATIEKMLSVLTPQQVVKWHELIGEPFDDLDKIMTGPGHGGPPPNDRGPGPPRDNRGPPPDERRGPPRDGREPPPAGRGSELNSSPLPTKGANRVRRELD